MFQAGLRVAPCDLCRAPARPCVHRTARARWRRPQSTSLGCTERICGVEASKLPAVSWMHEPPCRTWAAASQLRRWLAQRAAHTEVLHIACISASCILLHMSLRAAEPWPQPHPSTHVSPVCCPEAAASLHVPRRGPTILRRRTLHLSMRDPCKDPDHHTAWKPNRATSLAEHSSKCACEQRAARRSGRRARVPCMSLPLPCISALYLSLDPDVVLRLRLSRYIQAKAGPVVKLFLLPLYPTIAAADMLSRLNYCVRAPGVAHAVQRRARGRKAFSVKASGAADECMRRCSRRRRWNSIPFALRHCCCCRRRCRRSRRPSRCLW